MERTSPRRPNETEDDDTLWNEALSALGLLGAVLLIVLVITFVGSW